MHLDIYISELLYRYDCVTIPGFGAFLTEKVSAKLDETSMMFSPPKKSISFNEQLQTNDGLLASYVSDTEKLPYEVALKNIKRHVRSIKSYLVEGETISFNNIGELLLNEEGKIIFEPSFNVNYLTDSFGLSQIKTSKLDREVYRETVEEIEKVVPISISKESRKSRPYLKYAAIAVIALMTGAISGGAYYSNQIVKHNEIAQEEAHSELENKIQEATFIIENPIPSITLNVDKQQGNYHIVAGAFRVEENSDKKVKQLRELGYKARKIGVNKYGLHEVVYSSHEDRTEAQKALRTIRSSHNKDAWLLIKTLD